MTPWRKKETVTPQELAQILGCSDETIYRRVTDKKIKALQLGVGRLIFIPVNEVKRLLGEE